MIAIASELPLYDPTFIAAATASIVTILGALGGILVKLFVISREAEKRKVTADETHAIVNSRFDAMATRLDAALATIEQRKVTDAVAAAAADAPSPPVLPIPPTSPPKGPKNT